MHFAIKRMSFKHKNNKFTYYLLNYFRLMIPQRVYRYFLNNKLAEVKHFDAVYLKSRVDYYNKIEQNVVLPEDACLLSDFKLGKKCKTYFFDSYEYIRFFDTKYKACFLFGDVTRVPDRPSIVKSRPIADDNANSVVMKLVKIRHFTFTKDKYVFVEKKNRLVGRSKIHQPHRARFLEMYYGNPLCDIGNVDPRSKYKQWSAPRLTIDEQLKYKFILCLEGNDVASNLKWVMSSNSVAVMPKPKYETWFMEGTLIPNYHYILIKDDYSDLEEKINYYVEHTDEALKIIQNAHEYIKPFKNKKQEDIISFLVLQKYFQKTGQM